MAEVRWIKLAIDVFDNRKIRQIEKMPDGDALIIIWLKLLILAGTVNDGGMVYFTRDIPYTDQLLANQFDRPLATVQLALKVFQQFGMIELVDDLISVTNWQKYQNIDGLEKLKEQQRLASARYRERKRLEQHQIPPDNKLQQDSSYDGNMTIISHHAPDIDKRREEKSRKENTKRFAPPSLDEVKAYCQERGNGIDPEHFLDYYSARGWELKPGQKVKDWKACVRTWERNGYSNQKQAKKSSPVTKEDIERLDRYLGRLKGENNETVD